LATKNVTQVELEYYDDDDEDFYNDYEKESDGAKASGKSSDNVLKPDKKLTADSDYEYPGISVYQKNYHPINTLTGFDLTTHISAVRDDTTRPRRYGRVFHSIYFAE
jgi:hypothetical protein